MKIIIESINNGYLFSWQEHQEDDSFITKKEVIEIHEEWQDKEAMKRMLERTAEFFGYNYDKWGKENLDIRFNKKGHKVE